jgi:hypothetical protein
VVLEVRNNVHLLVGNADDLNSLLANEIKDDVFSLRETEIPFGDIRAFLTKQRVLS